MGRGLTVVSFVNLCQPGVNLCHGLVSVGQGVVAGGVMSLRGERHGSAPLFWCECSGSWGKWGCAVGDSRVWAGGGTLRAGCGDVRCCSDLFRVVRSVPEGLTAGVDTGGGGMVGAGAIVLCFAGVCGWGGG